MSNTDGTAGREIFENWEGKYYFSNVWTNLKTTDNTAPSALCGDRLSGEHQPVSLAGDMRQDWEGQS